MADYTIADANRRWKRFEKLGARMLTTLSPDAHLVYNESIRGSSVRPTVKSMSRFDHKRDGAEHLAIVQCRDYKVPLDVNAVGEFDSVIRDVAPRGAS